MMGYGNAPVFIFKEKTVKGKNQGVFERRAGKNKVFLGRKTTV